MLIGIDHGNKQIKTVHCPPFVSGLQKSITKPYGTEILKYQDQYYMLPDKRISYRKDKTKDDRYFILTLFAIAHELEARGGFQDEDQRIELAIGLPPAHSGAQNEAFTDYFKNRGIVEFELKCKTYALYINDVVCFPQAYAAAVTIMQMLLGCSKVLILNIGGFTANYL